MTLTWISSRRWEFLWQSKWYLRKNWLFLNIEYTETLELHMTDLSACHGDISSCLWIKQSNWMKFSIKDFFSKCDQIHSFLRIWSHLLKKPLMENFIFCAVKYLICLRFLWCSDFLSSFSPEHRLRRWRTLLLSGKVIKKSVGKFLL